jgi:ligand-binding sensor domain-containing protein
MLAFYSDLSAQEVRSGIKFEHVGIPGNIRSAFVIDMLQDPEGLLWFGSSTGLYRYNGQDFTHFQYTLPDSVPLFGREINALHWDTALNRLLVGTRQHGLLSYSYQDDTLRSLARVTAPINDITQTQDGTVWLLSFTNKLYKLESDSAMEIAVAEMQSPSALLSYGEDVIVGDLRKIVILKKRPDQAHPSHGMGGQEVLGQCALYGTHGG